MKKNLLAVILSTAMVASMMVACGSTEAPAEDTQVEVTDDAEDVDVDAEDAEDGEAADEACSDETFAQLQEDYATLVEVYDVVTDLYANDAIEADEDINNALTATSDIMTQMGEITQDSITEADAAALEGAIVDLLDVLGAVVDSMEVAE